MDKKTVKTFREIVILSLIYIAVTMVVAGIIRFHENPPYKNNIKYTENTKGE